jgi:hypothetical protein
MDKMIFRAALRASAKVALTATFASCGGAIQTTSNSDGRDAASPSATRPSPATIAPPYDGAPGADVAPHPESCDPPPVASLFPEPLHSGVPISDETFDCCLAVLAPQLRSDAQLPVLSDAAAHDPSVLGCCGVAIYRIDHDYGDPDAGAHDQADLADAGLGPGLGWSNLQPCCPPLSYPEGPTCTPWGPPMPPAMPEVA